MPRLSFTLFACLLFFHLPRSLSAPHAHGEQRDPQSLTPQIKTHKATFIGSTDDKYGVSTWLGIRYAQPPIGSLRLQPPHKVDNRGTINATSFGAQCFQLSGPANANMSEDCLYLNIFRPSEAALKEHDHRRGNKQDSGSLLVMLFLHGGAFNDGTGQTYDARSLVNTSVALRTPAIIVTINYRLNFFGFSGILLGTC